MIKHEATDAAGKVWKRTSAARTYTHCVVIHISAAPADRYGHEWPARSKAEWAGSLVNAQNNARRWERNRDDIATEIIEARIVGGK